MRSRLCSVAGSESSAVEAIGAFANARRQIRPARNPTTPAPMTIQGKGIFRTSRVDRGESPEDEDRGDYEEGPRHDPAPRAMEQPADVDRELLRFWSGQEHAVGERVEEALLGDPALPVYQVALHDGDLARGPSEADEAQPQPVPERLPEADGHSRAGA